MSKKLELSFLESKDGSHTLLRHDLNETYHSHNGAIQESLWVFIDRGLKYLKENGYETIKVLEIGFGTGLNAILAYEFAQKNNIKIEYVSLEPFPVPLEIAEKLNYTDFLEEESKEIFGQIHRLSWEEKHEVSSYFSIQKIENTLENFKNNSDFQSEITGEEEFDCIFYDAFAPSKQAEVWQLSNLEKTFNMTKEKGILVTYCAQGQFKRDLKTAGWSIETLDGAPPKREMVRAMKSVTSSQ
ncbi:tRNA (5-methylaminomethyl-2-thiouridine)(34)-methyltransferase MnmD [Bernardetia sp.]|uniref:tRNA (5-methylaminomethyl-2-thiouridine)(34)-methyltransferase MnmD n=1 Tax=Bernardetia sp. TaxID=1937974 RepID=UPI0025BED653|nr:tRNA (5-methylaminomethyl-2-thiouridine)(34)-methyltransferase MnmD [Bernardetia sp.]